MDRLNLDVEVIAAFIEKIHIFRSLKDDHLFDIVERLEERHYEAGQVILESGEPSRDFCVIYSGKVDCFQEERGQEKAVFVPGDYLGEEALLPKVTRHAIVRAQEYTVILFLSDAMISEIPEAIAQLLSDLKISVKTRQLIKEKHFDWILEDEVIYFLMRKHPILFWEKMILPLLIGFTGLALFIYWALDTSVPHTVWYISMFILGLFGIGLGWNWLDWRNDYYVVTNQRVIWLEKIIGLYDSRQEANLPEILSVVENIDTIEHTFFDSGTVTVRTMVGSIVMKHMHYPHQARFIIEEQWQRAQEFQTRQAKEELGKAIEEKFRDPIPLETKEKKEPPKKKTFVDRFIEYRQRVRNSLKLRYEEGKTITYRKHWVVLVKRAGIPSVATVVAFGFLFWQIYNRISQQSETLPPISFLILFAGICFLVFLWALYQYEDWRNDIFQVTDDKIFDIDKKPLGEVNSRSAPLENIQSTEYERRGILSVLFNYGTVYINIGTESFDFQNVWSPADVQQDINRRYVARRRKQEEIEAKQEREQMLDWLIAYHGKAPEFEKFKDNDSEEGPNTEEQGGGL